MVPFGLTPEQFARRYRKCLDGASPHLIATLTELFARPVPATVSGADVEFFLDDEGQSWPTAWIYYSGQNTKVDRTDLSIFPGRAMEIALGLDGKDDFDDRYSTELDFGGLNIAAELLKTWFAECWWKAGGWRYAVPVEVRVHDGWGGPSAIALSEGTR